MWRQIGVAAKISNLEFRAFAQRRQTGDFELLLSSTRPGFDDPIAFLAQYESSNISRGNKPSCYKNETYDRLIEKSTRTLELAGRRELLEEAERILLVDRPSLTSPLFYRSQTD